MAIFLKLQLETPSRLLVRFLQPVILQAYRKASNCNGHTKHGVTGNDERHSANISESISIVSLILSECACVCMHILSLNQY